MVWVKWCTPSIYLVSVPVQCCLFKLMLSSISHFPLFFSFGSLGDQPFILSYEVIAFLPIVMVHHWSEDQHPLALKMCLSSLWLP